MSNLWIRDKQNAVIHTISLAAILLCVLFGKRVNTDVFSFLIFISWITYNLFDRGLFIAKYIYVIFGAISCTVGVLICENNVIYLREIGEYTYRTGSLPPIVLYYWFLMFFLIQFDRLFKEKETKGFKVRIGRSTLRKRAEKYGLGIILAINVVLFLSVLTRPYFRYGVDRFGYASSYMPALAGLLREIPPLLSPLAVISVIAQKKWRIKKKVIKMLSVYLPYILFSFWIGEKFGQIWTLVSNLIIASTCMFEGRELKKEFDIKKIVFICVAMVVIVFVYFVLSTGGISGAIKSFYERMAMQGQLWWKIFDMNDGPHLNEFLDECKAVLLSITSKGNTKEYGIYRLMNMLAREDILESYTERGIRFSAQGMELPYYFFGKAALIFLPIIHSFIYALITNMYVHRIRAGRFFEAIMFALVMNIVITVLSQGDFYLLFANRVLLGVAIMIILWLSLKEGVLRARSGHYGRKIEKVAE